ncbi:MAG: hypothetical protein NTV93_17500 [Verrucomicrobia bacterium]|nr:hypothetical protein [Verrucomicrobiota bacterium]
MALSIYHVHAGYVDITIDDGGPKSGSYTVQDGPAAGHASSDPRGINESGSVTANCVNNATWDLRAIAFDVSTNKLTVVSGFNPLALNDGIGIGDIFIDTNNSYSVPSRPDGVGNGYFNYANSTAGYEYAIHLIDPSTGNLNYNIAALSGASVLQSTGYAQNAFSDPAKLIPSGADTSVSSGQFSVITLSDAGVLANMGVNVGTNGGTNYVFSFDLTGVSLANGATFRLTETCGNDLLVGHLAAGVAIAAVPETSTWVMGFLALGAVAFMVRRNARLSA